MLEFFTLTITANITVIDRYFVSNYIYIIQDEPLL